MFKRTVLLTLLISLTIILTSCGNKVNFIYIDFGNNTEVEKHQISSHEDIENIEIPEKEGYIYVGLYLDSQYKIEYSSNIEIKEIEYLYVKWQKIELTDEELFLYMYNKAFNNHLDSRVYIIEANGEAISGKLTQSIYSKKIVNNNHLHLFIASVGLVKAYVMLESNGSQYTLKKGKPDSNYIPKTITFEEEISLTEYLEVYGVDPYHLNYVVNEENLFEVTEVIEGTNDYTFKVVLKENAGINYKKYLVGVNILPSENVVFEQIKIEFIITKDNYFSKITYDEKYTLDVKIPLVGYSNKLVEALITETFNYN